jgi:hypothetical protein
VINPELQLVLRRINLAFCSSAPLPCRSTGSALASPTSIFGSIRDLAKRLAHVIRDIAGPHEILFRDHPKADPPLASPLASTQLRTSTSSADHRVTSLPTSIRCIEFQCKADSADCRRSWCCCEASSTLAAPKTTDTSCASADRYSTSGDKYEAVRHHFLHQDHPSPLVVPPLGRVVVQAHRRSQHHRRR